MTFHSILFERTEDSIQEETPEAPDCFVDLNLDQVLNAITSGRQEYHLKPLFYTPLKVSDAIGYRHEIMQDLEGQELYDHIQAFAQHMRTMRKQLEQADASRALFTVFTGGDEGRQGVVKIKKMAVHEEIMVRRDELVQTIGRLLGN